MKLVSRRLGFSAGFSALLCMAMMVPAVKAQSAMPPPPGAEAPPAATGQSPETSHLKHSTGKVLKRMTKGLSLTPDQKSQVKTLLDQRETQFEALDADTSLTTRDKKRKKRAIQADYDSKVKTILTDDQKAAYQKMKDERHAKHEGGHSEAKPASDSQ